MLVDIRTEFSVITGHSAMRDEMFSREASCIDVSILTIPEIHNKRSTAMDSQDSGLESGKALVDPKQDIGSAADAYDLTAFKKSLITSCNNCGYKGVMGWNHYRIPSSVKWLMWLSIPLVMVLAGIVFRIVPVGGFLVCVPALLLRLAFQCYYAQCPQCKTWLMLERSQVRDVKKVQPRG